MALGAEVVVAEDKESKGVHKRVLSLETFFVGPKEDAHRENVLVPRSIVTEIRIPAPRLDDDRNRSRRSIFLKARERESWDFAMASVALCLKLEGGAVESVRIVLGGVAPIPWRSQEAEKTLQGNALDERAMHTAADAVASRAKPLRDNAYKVDLIRHLISEALGRLIEGQPR
jgi:xanthine dehydrogenase YagS FAD-binding subunit